MPLKLKSSLFAIRDVIYGCLIIPIAVIGICILFHHTAISKPRQEAKRARDLAEAGAFSLAGSVFRRPVTPGCDEDVADARRASLRTRWRKKPKQSRISDQTQSRLFSLPVELRLQIWKLTIGGHAFNIDREPIREHQTKHRRLAHRQNTAGHCTRHWDCTLSESYVCGSYCSLHRSTDLLLSLPLTCRRIYAETLPILYQHNAITIHNHTRFNQPIWSCGRFDLLTDLETSFMLADLPSVHILDAYTWPGLFVDEIHWNRSWRTIAALPNLQSLTAHIQRVHWEFEVLVSERADERYGHQEEFVLLEPRKVTRPTKRWVLWLTWAEPRRPRDVEEYPFEIRRRGPLLAMRV